MNRFQSIIESAVEPDKNSIWLDNGSLKKWGPNGWEELSGGMDSIDTVDKIPFNTYPPDTQLIVETVNSVIDKLERLGLFKQTKSTAPVETVDVTTLNINK